MLSVEEAQKKVLECISLGIRHPMLVPRCRGADSVDMRYLNILTIHGWPNFVHDRKGTSRRIARPIADRP